MIKDLQDTEHMTRKAADLAAKVRLYRKLHPDRPVYLIGKSGGARRGAADGQDVAAGHARPLLSCFPPPWLQPTISAPPSAPPGTRSSPSIPITIGSSLAGAPGNSAPPTGFTTPPPACAASPAAQGQPRRRPVYRRLVEVPWTPAMIPEGHFSGHMAPVTLGLSPRNHALADALKTLPMATEGGGRGTVALFRHLPDPGHYCSA